MENLQSNHKDLGEREEIKANGGPSKKFSLQETISVFFYRLSLKGNAWMATLTKNQQRTLLVVFLFCLACYFVVLSGRTFLADAPTDQRGLPQVTPMPAPLPTVVPKENPVREPEVYGQDSLLSTPADTASSF